MSLTEQQEQLFEKLSQYLDRFLTNQEKQQEMYLNSPVVMPRKFGGYKVTCDLVREGTTESKVLLEVRHVPNLEAVGSIVTQYAFGLEELERLVIAIGKES